MHSAGGQNIQYVTVYQMCPIFFLVLSVTQNESLKVTKEHIQFL